MKSRRIFRWASSEDMYLNANIIGLLEASFEPQLVKGGEAVDMPGMGRAEMLFVNFFPFLLVVGRERKGLRGKVKEKVKTKGRELKDGREQEKGMEKFL